jgi:hypothetical protein
MKNSDFMLGIQTAIYFFMYEVQDPTITTFKNFISIHMLWGQKLVSLIFQVLPHLCSNK